MSSWGFVALRSDIHKLMGVVLVLGLRLETFSVCGASGAFGLIRLL